MAFWSGFLNRLQQAPPAPQDRPHLPAPEALDSGRATPAADNDQPLAAPAAQGADKEEPRAALAPDSAPAGQTPAPGIVEGALDAAALDPAMRSDARQLWDDMARSAPDPNAIGPAYLQALRRRRWRPAAEAVAAAFADALPQALWPLAELALLSSRTADHAATLAIGQRIERSFPDAPEGPGTILQALLALGHQHEAERYFAALPATLDDQAWFLQAGIRVSEGHGASDDVLAYAEKLRRVAPANPLGYSAATYVLRQKGQMQAAEAIVAAGLEQAPDDADIWREAAQVAQELRKDDAAYARWAQLRKRFPRSAAGFTGAIKLSQKLQQPAMTETLLEEGLAAFPANRDLLTAAARFAVRSERWKIAKQHWQSLIELSPDDPSVPLAAAMSLIGVARGRLRRLPGIRRRIETIHTEFPDYTPAYASHLGVLREAKLLDDAARRGAEWGARFPADVGLAIARARVAEDRGELAEAVAIIEAARQLAKPTGALESAHVRALSLAGQEEQAEAACEAALIQFADHPLVLSEHVFLATRRGDWQGALSRARQAQRRRPKDETMQRLVRRAQAQVLEEGGGDAQEEPHANAEDARMAELFNRFESLGATSAGCEFGLVQRRFGAEPLGLLRWARIDLAGLIDLLHSHFAGMGLEENTQLVVQRASANHSEYFIQDRRSGYWTHTFVKVEDTPYDRMLKQSLRRVQFLRGKLLEELDASNKIFVFKATKRLSPEELDRLFAALGTYGDYPLLCVTLADDTHPVGTLEMVRPGLFVGCAAMFMDAGISRDRGVDTERWRFFCERVAAWQDGQGAVAQAAAEHAQP